MLQTCELSLNPIVFEVNMARILIIPNNTEFPANLKFLKKQFWVQVSIGTGQLTVLLNIRI